MLLEVNKIKRISGPRHLYYCTRSNLDYEQSPIFPQGQQSERNASARENHPTREKATRGVSPFLAGGDFHAPSRFARSTIPGEKWGTTLAWGDFHAPSRFARSTILEEKWGTTRSLGQTKYCQAKRLCQTDIILLHFQQINRAANYQELGKKIKLLHPGYYP